MSSRVVDRYVNAGRLQMLKIEYIFGVDFCSLSFKLARACPLNVFEYHLESNLDYLENY